MARTFRRGRDGRVTVRLRGEEVALLRFVARDVASVVEAPPDGDIGSRLYPRAYLDPTEEAAETEYRSLTHDDLVEQRVSALAAITAALPAEEATPIGVVAIVLEPGQELLWLTALNDARLVLGTALGVTEDETAEFEPDDPRFDFGVCYQWFSYLQFELVELLVDELGEAGSDDP